MTRPGSTFARLLGGTAILLVASSTIVMAQTAAPTDAQWRKQTEETMRAMREELNQLKAERAKFLGKGAAPTAEEAKAAEIEAQETAQLKATVENLQNEVINVKNETEKPKDAVRVTTKGGLKVESEDGQYSFIPSGRLQVDSVWYDQDRARLGDGTEVRRAYLGMGGSITKLWDYKIIAELSSEGSFGMNDAFIQFNGLSPVTFTVGNFKEPFSLEDQTSDLFTTHMERSLISVFSPSRHIGAQAEVRLPFAAAPVTAAVGIFGETVTSGGAASEGDEGMDIAGRLTIAPTLAKDEFIHLGVGAFFRDPSDSSVSFSQRPESHVTGVRYLDTGSMTMVDKLWAVQPELAVVYGPFSVQGEYTWVQVERQGADEIDLNGYYAEASVFLTGESRVYKNGKFDRVSPKKNFLDSSGFAGGLGAIQLAARYSHLDFNDRAAGLEKGEEKDLTLGLTWITNPYVRFMFETVMVETSANSANTNVVLFTPGVSAAGDDPTIYQMRAQVDF
jgi:phosphate-selective porin OprO/OprP